ncbi:MAG: BREX-1 system phosphatase PglZ type A [Lachnospiraceae bacterium]|nr:BREX-1 system phosphatase PglZ type A [Lachnospiraceae bacterium]
MDIQNIQIQLINEFAKQETRIIFWFDDKGDYENEVYDLQLNNAQVYILDGSNWFYSKWLLHESDPSGKYLVYAPFSKPSDSENPLADIYYQSVPYYTDRVSQMVQEIGIDNRFKEHLSKHNNFWKNKYRIEKFKELGIDHYSTESIDIGLIAVLTDVRTPSFEEIVKQMMLSDSDEYLRILETNGLLQSYWNLCKKYFGYNSDKPNMNDMASSMIVTYAASTLRFTLPDFMKIYILNKRNDVVVFIRNIMDNILYQSAYDKLADKVDKTIRIVSKIEENLKKDEGKDIASLVDILGCDAFIGFDSILINWILDKLNHEILDAEIDGLNISRIAEQRTSKAFHFGQYYKSEYDATQYAYLIMKAINTLEVSSNPVELVKKYQSDMYLIDSYYRWFYYAFDQIADNEKFMEVRERVENIYSNTYLQKTVPKWNNVFENESIQNLGLVKQKDFYNHYLRAYEGKDRVIVIISDALRYECAKELMYKFEMDEKCDAKMEAMLGVLPSVTSVGMASLLPHNEINVDANMNITVDGNSCGDMLSRNKILKAKNVDNVAVSFDDIAKANKQTVRELLQGKKVVFVYHNQIDSRGDKSSSENEVFNACAEAIDEIFRLIKKLTGDISATKYVITADHGFLYKRDKLQEFDKVSYPKDVCTYLNKRFLLTTENLNEQGIVSRAMTYLNKMNNLFVTTPIGTDIFKVAGGGQNYVHGGSSLQEMLVPVVEVKTAKGKMETDFVDIILTTVSRKVTNLTTYFDFIQTEKMTDVMKGRSIVAYFTAENGEKISYDVPIMATSQSDAPEKRTYHEKFTLKSRKYQCNDKYYMVLVDANDDKNVLHSYEFMIDIAFVDDFGF